MTRAFGFGMGHQDEEQRAVEGHLDACRRYLGAFDGTLGEDGAVLAVCQSFMAQGYADAHHFVINSVAEKCAEWGDETLVMKVDLGGAFGVITCGNLLHASTPDILGVRVDKSFLAQWMCMSGHLASAAIRNVILDEVRGVGTEIKFQSVCRRVTDP